MIWWTLYKLKSNDSSVRERAEEKLSKLKSKRAVKPLVSLLAHKKYYVRISAAKVLGQIGDEQAIKPLVLLLKEESTNLPWEKADSLRRTTTQAISQFGMPGIDALVGVLIDKGSASTQVHPDPLADVITEILSRTGQMGIDILVKLLRKPNFGYRYEVIKAMSKITDVRIIEPLIETLEAGDNYVRKNAAETLLKLNWKPSNKKEEAFFAVSLQRWDEAAQLGTIAFEPLVYVLKEEIGEVRNTVIDTIGKVVKSLSKEEAQEMRIIMIEQIISSVKGKHIDLKPIAELLSTTVKALRKAGDEQIFQQLVAKLKDENSDVRKVAEIVLGDVKYMRTPEILLNMLKQEEVNITPEVINIMGQIGDTAFIEHLIVALHNQNSLVRLSAIEALGRIGGEQAIEHLITSLKDENSNVQLIAVKTLGKIGKERVVKPLINLLKGEKEYARVAAEALGEIGDKRAINALLPALENSKSFIHAEATTALAVLGDIRATIPLIALAKKRIIQPKINSESAEFPRPELKKNWTDPKSVINILTDLLKSKKTEMPDSILHEIAALDDVFWVHTEGDGFSTWESEERVNCSKARSLANEELIRRSRINARKNS